MAEPMSTARIEHIRALLSVPDVGGVSERIAHELLAEVDRLREEEALVAAMRDYAVELKRKALRFTASIVATVVVCALATWLVPEPWTFFAAWPACFGSGFLIGACEAWVEDRLEARHG